MKVGTFAGVGAVAAALLFASSASATTFISTPFQGATFTITTVSSTEFTFDITGVNALSGDWATATDLAAFAFANIGGTAGGISAQRITLGSPPTNIGSPTAATPGGLGAGGAGGCNNSGNSFFCFDIDPGIAVSGQSELKFDITATSGAFNYLVNPHLKIDWSGSADSDDPIGNLYSQDIGGAHGVPEPATWAMMLVGVGMIGGVMRSRRKMATAAI
jgi:hypothetical protein